MAVTGTITTKFVDEKGVDLGRQLVEKDYLISVYPNLLPQFKSAGMFVWGNNSDAQLGDNTTVTKSSPVQTIAYGTNWKQVAGGQYHSAAIKTDGTLWCWGANYAQLGDNTNVPKSSPVQTISSGTNWNQVSCGTFHTAAIKTDGTLWCWGANNHGELGDNTTISKSSPIQTIAGGSNWKQVSAGYRGTAAVKTDGTLWLWGRNSRGQIGDNTTDDKSSPVQTIAEGNNWQQVDCGQVYSLRITAAIKTDGTLWCWGYNYYGQLGDNTTDNKSSPVQTISSGTNWKQVSCGWTHMAAVKTDGTLWTWGENYAGGLGDNSEINTSSPIQTISSGTNWRQVAAGGNVTLAIKTDGSLWGWGFNYYYPSLGDNTTINKSSPVQTVAGGTNWKRIACGVGTAFAIRDSNY
jgi:alpha-tubulin suppressor-like RCC1 family protein